jgi:hypothetical protein
MDHGGDGLPAGNNLLQDLVDNFNLNDLPEDLLDSATQRQVGSTFCFDVFKKKRFLIKLNC